ncbi:MAG TPA: hypothetical protein VGG13_01845 [Candidatus Saccharimonadales bacterium]
MSKPFDEWNTVKKRLEARGQAPFFKEREVWFAAVGVNVGHEEDGKNDNYERPVLILKKFNRNLFFGVAFSSIFKPENDFYHTVLVKGKASSVILSQAKAYSAKRLWRRMDILDKAEFEVVKLLAARTLFGSEIIKTDLGEPRSSGPEGIYSNSVANRDRIVNAKSLPDRYKKARTSGRSKP